MMFVQNNTHNPVADIHFSNKNMYNDLNITNYQYFALLTSLCIKHMLINILYAIIYYFYEYEIVKKNIYLHLQLNLEAHFVFYNFNQILD